MKLIKSILNLISGGNSETVYVVMSNDVPTRYDGSYYADRMLWYLNVPGTRVETCYGSLEDGYCVSSDVVYLTAHTHSTRSAISAAIACHEVGHAVVYKSGFVGSEYETEYRATKEALTFLARELSTDQLIVARDFLYQALSTYKK